MDSVSWTIALNGGLALASYGLARSVFRQPGGLTAALAAVVIFMTWLILGIESLGALRVLGRFSLLGWTAVLGLTALSASRWFKAEPFDKTKPGDRKPVEWTAVVALGFVLWIVAIYGGSSLFLPVKVVSDGPIYHLYFAARWWKSGTVDLIAAPFGENAATYFPAIGDYWFTWLMACWNGDRLAKIGQAPFFAVAGLTVFDIARRLGAGTSSAIVATALFLTVSPFLLFTFEPNVDTIFVAFYLLAVDFWVRRSLDDPGRGNLILSGLSAGLALATKPTGIVFILPLLILQGLDVVCGRSSTRRRKGIDLLTLAASPWLVSAWFYARNFRLTGNPLYPLHLTMSGRVILSGWYGRDVMTQSPYYIPFRDFRSLADILAIIFDPRLVPLWLLGLFAAPWIAGTSDRPTKRPVFLIIFLVFLNLVLYWGLIPYRTQQRFVFQSAALAAVPLAVFLERSQWLRRLAVGFLILHLFTAQSWPFDPQSPPWDFSRLIPSAMVPPLTIPRTAVAASLVVGIGLTSFGIAWTRLRRERGGTVFKRFRWSLPSAAFVLVWLTLVTAVSYPWGADPRLGFFPIFPEYVRGWMEMDFRSGASGVRVAYAGNALPYYLMGVGLRNEVRYVNVDAHRDWLLHDYHREAAKSGLSTWNHPRPGWDRIHPDYKAWLANLHDEGIRLLVVNRANPDEGLHNIADRDGFPIERQWAESHPESFQPLYGVVERDPQFRLYRVR